MTDTESAEEIRLPPVVLLRRTRGRYTLRSDPLLSADSAESFTEALRGEGLDLQVESIEPGTLRGKAEGVLLSFLEYRYPLLKTSVDWEEYGCRLASLDDLARMKLSAIGSRGAKKDFIDIHALGQAGHTLDGMLSLYQRKFQTPDIAHVLFSLTYFDDAEPDDMPEMIWDVSWEEVKRAIEGTVLTFEQRDRTRPVEGMEG